MPGVICLFSKRIHTGKNTSDVNDDFGTDKILKEIIYSEKSHPPTASKSPLIVTSLSVS